jgi:hypothetical protein
VLTYANLGCPRIDTLLHTIYLDMLCNVHNDTVVCCVCVYCCYQGEGHSRRRQHKQEMNGRNSPHNGSSTPPHALNAFRRDAVREIPEKYMLQIGKTAAPRSYMPRPSTVCTRNLILTPKSVPFAIMSDLHLFFSQILRLRNATVASNNRTGVLVAVVGFEHLIPAARLYDDTVLCNSWPMAFDLC